MEKSNGASKEAVDSKLLPAGTTHVEIAEIEPETTFLRYVALEYTADGGKRRTATLLGGKGSATVAKVLRPGQSYRYTLPKHLASAKELRLVVQGFYTRDEAIASTR